MFLNTTVAVAVLNTTMAVAESILQCKMSLHLAHGRGLCDSTRQETIASEHFLVYSYSRWQVHSF